MGFFSLSFSRIVLRGQNIVNSVVPQSNLVFDFQKAYRLSESKVQLSSHLSVPLSWEDGLVSPSDGLSHQWRPDPGPLGLESQSLWFHDLKTCLNFWLIWSRDDAPSVCSFGWLGAFHSQPPSALFPAFHGSTSTRQNVLPSPLPLLQAPDWKFNS